MKLKAFFTTSAEIPSGLAEYYEERDGGFHLAVEGMVPKGKLEEFRNNNIELTRERDELKQKLDGIDVDEYRRITSYNVCYTKLLRPSPSGSRSR